MSVHEEVGELEITSLVVSSAGIAEGTSSLVADFLPGNLSPYPGVSQDTAILDNGMAVNIQSYLGADIASSTPFLSYSLMTAVEKYIGSSEAEQILGYYSAKNWIDGGSGDDTLRGASLDDFIYGGEGRDIIIGRDGDDLLVGGESVNDIRDMIYGGDGNDTIDGGYGNDELRGDAGNDVIAGGFGGDTVIGGTGDDTLTGSALGDEIYGGDGMDFVNGGFGHDRVNGGADADQFYHLGIFDHGSDWIQDYSSTEGDVLVFGGEADASQFQVNFTETAGAGENNVEEAFVIYRPTGQILWALIDGAGQEEINLSMGGDLYDLLA